MITPKAFDAGGSFTLPEDASLTGILLTAADDSLAIVALNGATIAYSPATGSGTGTTKVVCFIPLKISLKTGMKLSNAGCAVVYYFG